MLAGMPLGVAVDLADSWAVVGGVAIVAVVVVFPSTAVALAFATPREEIVEDFFPPSFDLSPSCLIFPNQREDRLFSNRPRCLDAALLFFYELTAVDGTGVAVDGPWRKVYISSPFRRSDAVFAWCILVLVYVGVALSRRGVQAVSLFFIKS